MDIVSLQEWNAYRQMLNYILLFIGFSTFFVVRFKRSLLRVNDIVMLLLAIIITYLIGNFPDMWNSGSDKANYFAVASNFSEGYFDTSINDWGFLALTWLLVKLPLDWYFFILAAIYVGGIYLFSKSLSKKYAFVVFVCMILNFQFISYGTNTIRAGLASSILLWAIAWREKKIWPWLLLVVVVFMHKSWLLPVGCYLIAKYKDNTKMYFVIWLLSIPVSAVAGGALQSLFASLIGDDRSSYLTTSAMDTAYHVGFRLDFIIYSCVPIALGYYYIYKRNFKDSFYKSIYNMYILANTFWILVIRANFSDRFAYLSWFIYSAVLIYPLVANPRIVPNSSKCVSLIILGLTLFYAYV